MTRAVILTTYFKPVLGGVESNAERLALFLHKAGLDVHVVTKRVRRDWPDTENLSGVSVERIGPWGERTAAGKWRLIPSAVRWLLAHRREHDVVCVVDYRGLGIAALLARLVTGKPVVFQGQTHGVLSGERLDGPLARLGLSPDGLLARAVKWPIRTIYGRADGLACISRLLEREALAVGLPRERVHFLPNAIDMTLFAPASPDERVQLRAQFGWPLDRPVCLFVGRLSREKGLMDLLEAWRRIQPTRAFLAVAGPDMTGNAWNVGPSARAFVAEHRLAEQVQFMGPQTHVHRLLQAADVAVQPSHFEAQGLSSVEALACGVPVIASKVGGLVDFVVEGENGLLTPPEQPENLALALATLLQDEVLRARLQGHARASVADDYDEAKVFGQLADLLTTLASAAHR